MPQLAKNATLKGIDDPKPESTVRKASRKSKTGRASQQRTDPTQGLEVAHPNAAAIDIGCAEHWASVRPDRAEDYTQRFGCCTAELNRLADWFKECAVQTVVMEATGNYWVVLYDILEERKLSPVVVNPRYAKNMTSRKGDIPDAQWMQKLHTYGLFANSFRPSQEIRVLRSYQRQ